jgi:hypothetical protein
MRIVVQDHDGSEMFSYDTDKETMCLCPARAEKPLVIEALAEAARFLREPPPLAA